ncbi:MULTISPECIES: IS66 family insertion sequence element accessory protein TnpB [unclassified Haematobacter]|uniref:IS66 family insertion sequence element accessory protein TnpB n=1 Tax=unclassified Haematobacter TaxID=2640585 RepID=UPI003917CA71
MQSEFVFIFRAKRLTILVWDGTGLVLIHKRIKGAGFVWPRASDGIISVNRSQFEGLDRRKIPGRQHAIAA